MDLQNFSPEDAAELAARLSFPQLSPAEQAAVIAALGSAGEYAALRRTILAARTLYRGEGQSSGLRAPAALHEALAKQHRKQRHSPVLSLLLRPVPLYQAGLAAALVLLAIAVFQRPHALVELPPPPDSLSTRIVYRPAEISRDSLAAIIADSICRYIADKKTAKTPVVSRGRRREYAEMRTEQHERRQLPPNFYVGLDNVPVVMAQRRGVTSSEAAALAKFTYAQPMLR
jgi:hypothetical protein